MSANEDTGPERRWIVRSHIGWGGEKPLPSSMRFKNLEGKPKEDNIC